MPALLDPPRTATRMPPPAVPAVPTEADPPPETDPRSHSVGREDNGPADWVRDAAPIEIPADAVTIGGFLAWCDSPAFPAGLKATLLDGRLWLEPRVDDFTRHNLLKLAVARALGNYGEETDLGEAFVDGAMFVMPAGADPEATGREPDCGFNLYESFRTGRVRIETRTAGGSEVLVGRPDLLVECVSGGSVEKDTVTLRAAYLAAGVREYWVLDGRGDALAFDLLTRTDDATDWTETTPDGRGFRFSPILNRRVRIDRGTDPLDRVRWDVRLVDAEPAA